MDLDMLNKKIIKNIYITFKYITNAAKLACIMY